MWCFWTVGKAFITTALPLAWQVNGTWCHLPVTVIYSTYLTASDCPSVKRTGKAEPPKLKRERGKECPDSSELNSGTTCLQKEALETQPFSHRAKSLGSWRKDWPLQIKDGTKPPAVLLGVAVCTARETDRRIWGRRTYTFPCTPGARGAGQLMEFLLGDAPHLPVSRAVPAQEVKWWHNLPCGPATSISHAHVVLSLLPCTATSASLGMCLTLCSSLWMLWSQG